MLFGNLGWLRLIKAHQSNCWHVGVVRRTSRLTTNHDADSDGRGLLYVSPELIIWCIDDNAHKQPNSVYTTAGSYIEIKNPNPCRLQVILGT